MCVGFLTLGAGAGCVVTDQIDFPEEPNYPPTILDAPASAALIGRIIWIDKASTPMWHMAVKVRELNVTQPLKARWRLVTKDDLMPHFFEQPLAVQGDQLLRDLQFDVQSDSLHVDECALLQLAVSGSFVNRTDPVYFDATKDDTNSDLALASWTIWEGQGPSETADQLEHVASSCITIEAFLPTVMSTTTAGAAGAQP